MARLRFLQNGGNTVWVMTYTNEGHVKAGIRFRNEGPATARDVRLLVLTNGEPTVVETGAWRRLEPTVDEALGSFRIVGGPERSPSLENFYHVHLIFTDLVGTRSIDYCFRYAGGDWREWRFMDETCPISDD
jgi:hypothetical protein